MKKILLLLTFIFILVLATNLLAQESGYGIGVILGEPTGISGKYWLNDVNAVDAGLAFDLFNGKSSLAIHADYLYHNTNLIKWKYKLPVYYGFGLRMRFSSNTSSLFGVRGIAGVMMYMRKLPIDVFFEIAPSFRLLPITGLDLDIAIGGRYYFNR